MASSHEKGRRSAVPKFGSFQARAPEAQPPHGRVSVTETAAEKAQRNTAEHHITRPDQASTPTSHSPVRSFRNPLPYQPADRKWDGHTPYYLDKKGDALILRYGTNDRSRVPGYRRIGAGRILGVDGFMKVEKLGSREEFLIRSPHESRSLLSSDKKNLLARGFRPQPARAVRIRQRKSEAGASATVEDFLPLKTSRKRKRDGPASEESSADEAPSYRSIHGKSRRHEHSSSDESHDSDASESMLDKSVSDPITTRSIELSKKTREHPDDIGNWFELVDHQNTLLDFQSGARAPTTAEIKSFADVKLSLLEQALSHNSDDRQRERLDLRRMEEGLKVWELKVALKKLAEAMQKYPNSFEIWKLYISFLQTTLSAFQYDKIKQLYVDKLHSLGNKLGDLSTLEEKIECSEQIIYVFLRLTRFLADAGFAELASAAWQATLELNLARPSSLSHTEWGIPPSFQDYWESERPRLGESDWRGWASFVTDADQEPPDPRTSADAPVPPTTRDGYRAWHIVEQHRAQNAMIPARTLDQGAEDDPFRVVMFTDFQDIVLCFPTEMVSHIRLQLLDAFLVFCHLPPCLQRGNFFQEATRDQFLVRSTQDVPFMYLSSRASTLKELEDQQNKPPQFSYAIQQMCPVPETLSHSNHWFKYFDQPRDKTPPDSYQWVSTILKQLTRVIGIGELGPYALAFESMNEPGHEKKSAKTLLKKHSSNVDLYLGYSILESEQQNKAVARNVLSAALGLSSISPHDRVRLGIGAAWLELDSGDLAQAALQLCLLAEDGAKFDDRKVPEVTHATPSQILKAQQFFVTNRDYKASSGDIAQAVIYGEGLVLLDYLTQHSKREPSSQKQGDIWSAIARITQCSQDLVLRSQQHSLAHEVFLQSSARLLYYHASHGSFRPGLLREQLTQYLSYFPSNTIFHSLFAWREERLSINDRVRSLLQDHVLTRANASLSSHIFAISYELRTGNAHSARAAFERALASDICAHHVGLWIAYIRFCHARKELRTKAKTVFYRGIQACPWAKAVFMEAFGTLAREMDSAELKSVYSTMCEKGFRIHVDMDEFVENWRGEQKRAGKGRSTKPRVR
ncbi:DUF1740-domain-containing protein [Nemania sp. FL0916]|nr:DUF1740-domain-containing protein [Nemania sp. FL0916]